MIINIRGTNGSGKSTVVRSFIDGPNVREIELGSYPQKRGSKIIPGYVNEAGWVVVGSYKTACGGCDSIPTQDLAKACVKEAVRHGDHVLFEGIMISTIFQGWLEFSQKMQRCGHPYLWAYLDTPVDLCLSRIQARNGGKDIKESLVHDKFRSIEGTAQKARLAGEWVAVLDHQSPVKSLLEVIKCA